MLSTLRIKNLALVSDLTLEFEPGFNAITGETGAGKSMVIGALNLVLGERADRTLLRAGCDNCAVEAVFGIPKKSPIQGLLEDNGLEPCEDGQLILKRTFTASGANRQFVNGSAAPLSVLGEIGQWLVDIHGPHDHQSLLHHARQMAVLDAYGHAGEVREKYASLVRERAKLLEEKAGLVMDERTYAQQLDLLRFQTHEISDARLRADEEEEITLEHQRVSNAARLIQLAQQAAALLGEEEGNALAQAGAIGRCLQELHKLDPAADALMEVHKRAIDSLNELQSELGRYSDKLEVDPARLGELEERLNLIHSLKRKYGATLAEVIAFGEDARRKLSSLEQREGELARLQHAVQELEKALARTAHELGLARRKVAPALCKTVNQQLASLGFKQSHFEIALTTLEPSRDDHGQAVYPLSGLDAVEFMFAPNAGEPGRPLRAIASSGELARVMLALKTVLANEDDVPVLVFDEVDANIGGETAQAVGAKMRAIGASHQVLCITHLAPVAASAHAHYCVQKEVRDGRTFTQVQRMTKTSRVAELARMLGGQSQAALRHAEALLKGD